MPKIKNTLGFRNITVNSPEGSIEFDNHGVCDVTDAQAEFLKSLPGYKDADEDDEAAKKAAAEKAQAEKEAADKAAAEKAQAEKEAAEKAAADKAKAEAEAAEKAAADKAAAEGGKSTGKKAGK